MRAVITDVDNYMRRASLLTADGRRFVFGVAEWQGAARPLPGSQVDAQFDKNRLIAVHAGDSAGLFAGGWPKSDAYLPEDQASTRLSWILFSLDGRLPRLPYVLCLLLALLLGWLALPQIVIIHALADDLAGLVYRTTLESLACVLGYFVYYGGWFVLLWLAMAPAVKRLHDTGRTGLWMLLPVVFLWGAWIMDQLAARYATLPWPILPLGLIGGICFGLFLCFDPPSPGSNRYGAPPA